MPPGCINSCFAPNEAETYLARIPSRDGLRINKPAAGQPLLLKERNDDPTTIDDSVDRSSTESSRRISRNNLISSTFLKFTKEQKPALNERSSYDEALGDQPYEAKYSALEPLEVAHCPDDCEHVQPLPALPHPRLERGSSSLVDDEPETSSRDVRPKFVRTSDGEYALSGCSGTPPLCDAASRYTLTCPLPQMWTSARRTPRRSSTRCTADRRIGRRCSKG